MKRRLRTAGGVLAVIRAAALPLFLVAEAVVDHPTQNSEPFEALLALGAVYALAVLAAELAGRPLASPRRLAVVDLLLIAVLVATSGGPFSQLRYAFFMLPVGAALTLGPRPTAGLSVLAVAAYAVVALTYPDPQLERSDYAGFELTQMLFLAWMGLAATLLSALLARRTAEIERLSASRGRLVGQALDAEEHARRRLAEALHDEALQNVLAVRQMLGAEPERPGDRELLVTGLDRSVRQIREAVFDLHPYLLEQAGLAAALRAVAEEAGARSGFEATVTADPEAAGLHDRLLFALGRELIANVGKHARAERVEVEVRRRPAAVRLTVTDDGIGVDPQAARTAPLRGHIGLASIGERAEAIGGTFALEAGPEGRGTRASVTLPAPVARADGPRAPAAPGTPSP